MWWDKIKAWEIPGIINVLFFLIVGIWEYYRWKRNEKLTKDVVGLTAEYKKKQTIHRVQFETEFNIYKELWKNMVKIATETKILDSYISAAKDSVEKKNSCLKKMREAHDLIAETSNAA